MTAGIIDIHEAFHTEVAAREYEAGLEKRYPRAGYGLHTLVARDRTGQTWEVRGHRFNACD